MRHQATEDFVWMALHSESLATPSSAAFTSEDLPQGHATRYSNFTEASLHQQMQRETKPV
jgi:hypothetical protein